MNENAALVTMSEVIEVAMCQLITARTGIVIHDHQRPGLQSTLTRACLHFGYEGIAAYYQALLDKPGVPSELAFVIEDITVGESYFFRDSAQMALLRDSLLPAIIAKKRLARDYSLRIWSAGCSNGQEIYSLLILLMPLLPDINHWTLHLLATDINAHVLTSAASGCYRQWSLRATPPDIIQTYFTKTDDDYYLDETICNRVKFRYLNLSEDSFPALITETYAMDLILCRNVLIYIDPQIAHQIIKRFSDALVSEGILLLGPSDHVTGLTTVFNYVYHMDTAYYVKSVPLVRPSVDRPVDDLRTQPMERKSTAPLATPSSQTTQQGRDPLLALMRAGRWDDLVTMADQWLSDVGMSVSVLHMKALALANLGRTDEALLTCEQSLQIDSLYKHTYLTQGIVLMDQEKFAQAEVGLRKANYLDHQFPEAHYQLGLLLLHRGKRTVALKHIAIALTLAEASDPSQEISHAPGMTYAQFSETLRQELTVSGNAPLERFMPSDKGSTS